MEPATRSEDSEGERPCPSWVQTVAPHPCTREIAKAWRRLTGGRSVRDGQRRTLLACSGGADSTALALALGSSAGSDVVIGHVRHDIRPGNETLADEQAVERLAQRLGIALLRRCVHVAKTPGNLEANARRARYAALVEMAREAGCGFVATGHQGDDQLETMLMRLVRGSGPRAMAGMASRRPLERAGGQGPAVVLVRPMLGVSRSQSEDLCRAAGIAWRQDSTNSDVTRWRSRLRVDVVPVLRELRVDLHRRALTTSELLRDAAEALEREAQSLLAKATCGAAAFEWARRDVEAQRLGVLGEALRRARGALVGPAGADRLRAHHIHAIHDAIADPDRRRRLWTVAGLRIELDAARLRVERPTPA